MALHAARLHKRVPAAVQVRADPPDDDDDDDSSSTTTRRRVRTSRSSATAATSRSPTVTPIPNNPGPAPTTATASRTRATPAPNRSSSSSHSSASTTAPGGGAPHSSYGGLSTGATVAIAVAVVVLVLAAAFLAVRFAKRRKTGGYIRRKSDDFSEGKEHKSFGNLAVLSPVGVNEKSLNPSYKPNIDDEWHPSSIESFSHDPRMYQQQQGGQGALFVPAMYSPEPPTSSSSSPADSTLGLLNAVHPTVNTEGQVGHDAEPVSHSTTQAYTSLPLNSQPPNSESGAVNPFEPASIGMALTAPQNAKNVQQNIAASQGPFADPEDQFEGDTSDRGKLFIVRRTFRPDREDELMISLGDRIEMISVFDDGWCKGINLDPKVRPGNGPQQGFFPRDCVEEIKGAVLQRVPTLPPLDLGDNNGLSAASRERAAAAEVAAGSASATPAIQVSRPLSRDEDFEQHGSVIDQFPSPLHSSKANLAGQSTSQPLFSQHSSPFLNQGDDTWTEQLSQQHAATPYQQHHLYDNPAYNNQQDDSTNSNLYQQQRSYENSMMMMNLGMGGGAQSGQAYTDSNTNHINGGMVTVPGKRTSSLIGHRDADLFVALGKALDDHGRPKAGNAPLVK